MEHLPSTLTYTLDPPTEVGWYWMRFKMPGQASSDLPYEIVSEVFQAESSQMIVRWLNSTNRVADLSGMKIEWAGPIPSPA